MTHLRTILADAGVLSARDERPASLDRSAGRRIARVKDPTSREALRSFTTWHHLWRLRAIAARKRFTQDQVTYAVNSLTAAVSLLNSLRVPRPKSGLLHQADIDDWLANDPFLPITQFVTWAVAHGLAGDIETPASTTSPFAKSSPTTTSAGTLADDSSTMTRSRSRRRRRTPILLYATTPRTHHAPDPQHVLIAPNGAEPSLASTPISLPPMV